MVNHRAYRLHHVLWQALDFVYPPRCPGCGKTGSRFCNDCFDEVKRIGNHPVCPQCGIPQAGIGVCAECQRIQPKFTALRSWGLYEGTLRTAIHNLKYHSDMGISEVLARPLSEMISSLPWQIDLLTAVPLSRKRTRERGYNQSALLANWVSASTGIPFLPEAIKRTRETISQVGLHADQRRSNVMGAFTANTESVSGKSILVVDDVTTTGATMLACAQAFHAANSGRIYGLTLARAGHIDLN
jgi:ComF family protein